MKKTVTTKGRKRKKGEKLKPQHEMFCVHMTRPGAPTFNNAALSYACAYNPKMFQLSREVPEGKTISPYHQAYESCSANGSRLIGSDRIRKGIQKRMLKLFHDNDALDERLSHLAFQNTDMHVALAATRDVNKLKKRLNDDPLIPAGAAPITKIEIVMPK